MASIFRTRLWLILGAVALATLAVECGKDSERTEIRTATIGGVKGPVYYSVVEGRYIPIGRIIDGKEPAAQQLADALPPRSGLSR